MKSTIIKILLLSNILHSHGRILNGIKDSQDTNYAPEFSKPPPPMEYVKSDDSAYTYNEPRHDEEPGRDDEVEEPDHNNEVLKPVEEPGRDDEVEEPDRNNEVVKPVEEPDRNNEVEEPVRDTEVEEPVRDYEVEKPVRDYEVEKPVRDTEVEEPVRDYEVEKPVRDYEVEKPVRDYEVEKPVRDYEVVKDMCYSKCKIEFPQSNNSHLSLNDIERFGKGKDIIIDGDVVSPQDIKEITLSNNDIIMVHIDEVIRVRDNRIVLDVEQGHPSKIDNEKISKLRDGESIELNDGTQVYLRDGEVVRLEDDMVIYVSADVHNKISAENFDYNSQASTRDYGELSSQEALALANGEVVEYKNETIRIIDDNIVKVDDWSEIELTDYEHELLESKEEDACNILCLEDNVELDTYYRMNDENFDTSDSVINKFSGIFIFFMFKLF